MVSSRTGPTSRSVSAELSVEIGGLIPAVNEIELRDRRIKKMVSSRCAVETGVPIRRWVTWLHVCVYVFAKESYLTAD